jgi:hypothetical protein
MNRLTARTENCCTMLLKVWPAEVLCGTGRGALNQTLCVHSSVAAVAKEVLCQLIERQNLRQAIRLGKPSESRRSEATYLLMQKNGEPVSLLSYLCNLPVSC